MAKKRTKKQKKKLGLMIDMTLLVIFSFVLFTNNLTNLFQNFGIQSQINVIAWFGIMGSLLYAFWQVVKENLK